MNKKEREAMALQERLLERARDAGRATYQAEPDAMLVIIHRMASTLYAHDKGQAFAFVEGYQLARAQREEYLREVVFCETKDVTP